MLLSSRASFNALTTVSEPTTRSPNVPPSLEVPEEIAPEA
jgi:hypothetical protein